MPKPSLNASRCVCYGGTCRAKSMALGIVSVPRQPSLESLAPPPPPLPPSSVVAAAEQRAICGGAAVASQAEVDAVAVGVTALAANFLVFSQRSRVLAV
jgi:hypothetical protein